MSSDGPTLKIVKPPGPAAPAAEPQPHSSGDHSHHEEGFESAEGGEGNWLVSYADMMTLLMAFFAIMFSFSKIDQHKFDSMRAEISKKFGGTYTMPFEDIDKTLRELIQKEHLEDKVHVEQDGSAITIVFQGTVFFEVGGVDVAAESKALLDKILDIIGQKAQGFPIFVEGHTDDSVISTQQFPSNWELSGARAAHVVRMLEARSFPRPLLHPQGFSDSKPLVPNRDAAGNAIPENQAKNRRVMIRIEREDKKD